MLFSVHRLMNVGESYFSNKLKHEYLWVFLDNILILVGLSEIRSSTLDEELISNEIDANIF